MHKFSHIFLDTEGTERTQFLRIPCSFIGLIKVYYNLPVVKLWETLDYKNIVIELIKVIKGRQY